VFANQIKRVNPDVAAEAKRLADLLGQSLYSGAEVERPSLAVLKPLWQQMIANAPVATMPSESPTLAIQS